MSRKLFIALSFSSTFLLSAGLSHADELQRSADGRALPSATPTPVIAAASAPQAVPAQSELFQMLDTEIVPLSIEKSDPVPSQPVLVVVDKGKHLTHVLQEQNGALVEVLCVLNATGKPATPTPEGRMVVIGKQLDPVWTPPPSIDPAQRKVAPFSKTHKNPLGVANIRLSRGCIGLHGTNEPKRIGLSVSHGCVRHRNDDILQVYKLVRPGTPVYIVHSYESITVKLQDVARLSQTERKQVSSTPIRKDASHV